MMDRSIPRGAGSRVRHELPVHRVVTLAAHNLELLGDPDRAAAPVHRARFELEAGTLILVSPADCGRTLILCLTGELEPTTGSIEIRGGRAVQDTGWRLALAEPLAKSDRSARAILADAGQAASRAAIRLGLDPVPDCTVAELDPVQRTLIGLAAVLGDSPDAVALDDPGKDLNPSELGALLEALRDLVDIEGRTILVASDLHTIPPDLHTLLDRIVALEPTVVTHQ